jgi:hypothetical protein
VATAIVQKHGGFVTELRIRSSRLRLGPNVALQVVDKPKQSASFVKVAVLEERQSNDSKLNYDNF